VDQGCRVKQFQSAGCIEYRREFVCGVSEKIEWFHCSIPEGSELRAEALAACQIRPCLVE
jgi:hypothetical protein